MPNYVKTGARRVAPKIKKKHRLRNFFIVLFTFIVLLECTYFYLCFTDNAFISHWRNIYVQTALSTMRHQWLATALLPDAVVKDTIARIEAGREQQIGANSSWDIPEQSKPEPPVTHIPEVPEDGESDVDESLPIWVREDREGAIAFFELFHEVDPTTLYAWLDEHPEAMEGGWSRLNIDEAGLDQEGTTITTTKGDQILAINVPDQLLLIRVKDTTWRGILAVCKDPSRVGMRYSAGIGSYGQTVKQIAEGNGAILGTSGSTFQDPEGRGNGGQLAGFAVCNGDARGNHMSRGHKRLELRSDDRLYITDTFDPVGDDVTDAAEFQPALIIDGKIVVDNTTDWNGNNPRTILGQTNRGEIMMLVVEGRLPTVSLGVSVVVCAELLYDYNCVQAMNLDGGTSSVLYYNGRTVTLCSNESLKDGRTLPNGWLYFPAEKAE